MNLPAPESLKVTSSLLSETQVRTILQERNLAKPSKYLGLASAQIPFHPKHRSMKKVFDIPIGSFAAISRYEPRRERFLKCFKYKYASVRKHETKCVHRQRGACQDY